jgi:hypothetical protein
MNAPLLATSSPPADRDLTPEEDAIGDPDDADDDVDDTLPADLWYRSSSTRSSPYHSARVLRSTSR